MVQTATSQQAGIANSGPEVRVVRHAQVCEKLQVSSATLFDMVARGIFPKPFALIPGGRSVGWLTRDVDQWILDRKGSGDRGSK